MFIGHAPLIDRATFNAFQAREDLRNSFLRGFKVMMEFYGYKVENLELDSVKLERAENHIDRLNHIRVHTQ